MKIKGIAKDAGIGVGLFAGVSVFRALILYWAWNWFVVKQQRSVAPMQFWQAYGIAFAMSILFANLPAANTKDISKIKTKELSTMGIALAAITAISWGIMRGTKVIGTTNGMPIGHLTTARRF